MSITSFFKKSTLLKGDQNMPAATVPRCLADAICSLEDYIDIVKTSYRRRCVVNRQEDVEPFRHPFQNSEPRCRSVALWQSLSRVRRTHHTFLEGGLESRPPFQLVSSIEFWSVVLTAFDQGASKSAFGWSNLRALRAEKSNPASLGKDDVQKTRTLCATDLSKMHLGADGENM